MSMCTVVRAVAIRGSTLAVGALQAYSTAWSAGLQHCRFIPQPPTPFSSTPTPERPGWAKARSHEATSHRHLVPSSRKISRTIPPRQSRGRAAPWNPGCNRRFCFRDGKNRSDLPGITAVLPEQFCDATRWRFGTSGVPIRKHAGPIPAMRLT